MRSSTVPLFRWQAARSKRNTHVRISMEAAGHRRPECSAALRDSRRARSGDHQVTALEPRGSTGGAASRSPRPSAWFRIKWSFDRPNRPRNCQRTTTLRPSWPGHLPTYRCCPTLVRGAASSDDRRAALAPSPGGSSLHTMLIVVAMRIVPKLGRAERNGNCLCSVACGSSCRILRLRDGCVCGSGT
jgi:hypothetical protein